MNVLHVAAEVFPLVKTGGLADVAAALPPALCRAGADARLLIPGYPQVLAGLADLTPLCDIGPQFGAARVRVLTGRLSNSGVAVYVIDSPWHYRRADGPYQDADGRDWADNLQRFALLGWVAAQLGCGGLDPAWTPDVLHAHDWHAGLACAYVHAHPAARLATVFTIHNLAFQGRFPLADFVLLGLPAAYLTQDGLEYHRTLSFMKAGLQLADRVTTVSPTYAREIAGPDFGFGLDGVIRHRAGAVSGILNGIDTQVWNPATDTSLAGRYDARSLAGKAACKRSLQESLGLRVDADAMLVGIVSRLSDQKGLDLVLGALPTLLECGAQLVVQGKGDAAIEEAFLAASRAWPDRIAVRIAYDEAMAHRVVAGADAILVPSRFEPCGLTQLYGLAYGTLPIVRRVGGLADTVTDAGDGESPEEDATGFTFEAATPQALADALRRAATRFARSDAWRAMQVRAMTVDNDWTVAAQRYLDVYAQARADVAARVSGT